jgi:hypothetical protein
MIVDPRQVSVKVAMRFGAALVVRLRQGIKREGD